MRSTLGVFIVVTWILGTGALARAEPPPARAPLSPEAGAVFDRLQVLSRLPNQIGTLGSPGLDPQFWDRVNSVWQRSAHRPEVQQKLKKSLVSLEKKAWRHNLFLWTVVPGVTTGLLGARRAPNAVGALVTFGGFWGLMAASYLNRNRQRNLDQDLKTLELETIPQLEAELAGTTPVRLDPTDRTSPVPAIDPTDDLPLRPAAGR
jgi:hypothetical protein